MGAFDGNSEDLVGISGQLKFSKYWEEDQEICAQCREFAAKAPRFFYGKFI